MYCAVLLSSVLFSLHASCTPQFYGHHGRRVCVDSAGSSRVVTSTESFIQPVHTPYITMCPTHRICSTYKTVYKVSYRQVTRSVPISSFYSECCPGWRRLHSHNCNQALCVQECTNGGSCIRPNHCACPLGWTGRYCQIDVDECKGSHGCTQQCLNSAGSYRCACSDGFRLTEDGRTCRSNPTPSPPPPTPSSDAGGLVENVTEEVQILRNRVELLEQKLEMVLAPTNFLSDETNFLSHSLRQLDRIDSLSEQVGFLEERLGTCSCQEN
uniref:EGF-like-domain, multiple 7 n=1 Tax=Astyanax mexicanus TaxID=7994 RepID=A0A3B1JNW6_ASTMX